MVKPGLVGVCRLLLLGAVLSSCRAREDAGAALSEVTEEKRSALVVRLFDAAFTYATGSIAEAVGVADLDGDGRSDIAVVTGSSGNPPTTTCSTFHPSTDGCR